MQNLDLQRFSGEIVIVAPHMDDEALACGGLIAKLPDKNCIHIFYVTDGMKSPAPIIPERDEISSDLGRIRMQESIDGMKLLGVPEHNLHFLGLPEGHMQRDISGLRKLLRERIKRIKPQHILVPFRFDRHPDHLIANQAIVSDIRQGTIQAQLVEYFVYYRWRLMPKQDIRKYIRPQFLYLLDIGDVARSKRKALDCFTSQTTIFYPWQTRPVLTSTLLDEECQNPEYFVIAPVLSSSTAVFSNLVLWIQLVHRLEPLLLRWKYLTGAYLKRILQSSVH